MIRKLLLQLRQQPKAAKDGLALGTAAIFTALVALVWTSTLPSRAVDVTAQPAETHNAFGTFLDAIKEQTNVSNSTPELEEVVEAFKEEINLEDIEPNPVQSASVVATTSAQQPQPQEVRIVTISTASTSATSSATQLTE